MYLSLFCLFFRFDKISKQKIDFIAMSVGINYFSIQSF